MPQLDLVTFSSQIFWLVLILIIFFGIISRIYVDRVSKLLKLRKK